MSSPSILQATVRIRPDVEALRRDVRKAGKDVEGELGRSGAKAGKKLGDEVGAGLEKGTRDGARKAGRTINTELAGKMQATGAAMTAGITLPLLAGMNMAVNAAGSLNETLGASEQLFGSSFGEMKAWADGALDSMGLAASTVLNAANSMGGMFRGMGIEQGKSAEMTQTLIERARDMALFYDTSSEEMLTAFRSGMSGEMEPLKRFGVILSQTAVEAKAVSAGLVTAQVDTAKFAQAQVRAERAGIAAAEALKVYGENSLEYRSAAADLEMAEASLADVMAGKVGSIDQATLAQARMLLLMEQSSYAAGQYKREEDSLAATTERTREGAKQLAEEYGQKLLPAKVKLLEALGGILDFFNKLPGPMQNTVVVLAALAAAAGPLMGLVGTIMQIAAAHNVAAAAAGRHAAATNLIGGGKFGGMAALGKGGLVVGAGLASFFGTKWLLEKDWGSGSAKDWFRDTAAAGWLADNLPGMATGGTVAAGGLVQVGERGREVLSLPAGAQVSPNGGLTDLASRLDRIASLLEGGGAGGVHVEVINAAGMDERRLARELDAVSRRAAATRTTTRRTR